MVCLPDTGVLSGSIFAAPLLLVRGLGRRAVHWLVISHQRQLQKLSVRRRHRQTLSQKARPCSEPLVLRTFHQHDCKIRPRTEPAACAHHTPAPVPVSGRSPGVGDAPAGQEVNVYISGIHVPVKPLIVICSHAEDTCAGRSRSCILRVPPVSHSYSHSYSHSCSHSHSYSHSHSCSSQRCQDEAPLLARSSSADSRDTVSRQGQGVGPQRQGLNVGNAKSHPVTSQGPPTIPPKWPPPSLPGFQNQPPSSNVTHNRQHDSSSEGFSFSQNRPPNKGSPNLNSNRPPMPTPAPNISGPAIGPPFAAGHPSGQYTELYPGPQHQIKPVDYHKSNEIPKEMAPALPGVPSTLPRIGQTSSMLINLQGGGSIELLPLYRRVMDQPYFYTISRAKSREILENADDGIFLIRPSTRSKDPLTLCLKHGGRIYNINIRHRRDGRFALGSEKSNEMAFSSIEEIIATHRREPIRLQSGERAILTASPPKNGHDYAEMSDIVQRN